MSLRYEPKVNAETVTGVIADPAGVGAAYHQLLLKNNPPIVWTQYTQVSISCSLPSHLQFHGWLPEAFHEHHPIAAELLRGEMLAGKAKTGVVGYHTFPNAVRELHRRTKKKCTE